MGDFLRLVDRCAEKYGAQLQEIALLAVLPGANLIILDKVEPKRSMGSEVLEDKARLISSV